MIVVAVVVADYTPRRLTRSRWQMTLACFVVVLVVVVLVVVVVVDVVVVVVVVVVVMVPH